MEIICKIVYIYFELYTSDFIVNITTVGYVTIREIGCSGLIQLSHASRNEDIAFIYY